MNTKSLLQQSEEVIKDDLLTINYELLSKIISDLPPTLQKPLVEFCKKKYVEILENAVKEGDISVIEKILSVVSTQGNMKVIANEIIKSSEGPIKSRVGINHPDAFMSFIKNS